MAADPQFRFGPPVAYMPVSFQAGGLFHPGFWQVKRAKVLPIRFDVSGGEAGSGATYTPSGRSEGPVGGLCRVGCPARIRGPVEGTSRDWKGFDDGSDPFTAEGDSAELLRLFGG